MACILEVQNEVIHILRAHLEEPVVIFEVEAIDRCHRRGIRWNLAAVSCILAKQSNGVDDDIEKRIFLACHHVIDRHLLDRVSIVL